MPDIIECAFDVGIDHPGAGGVRPCQTEHFFDGVVTSSPRAIPVTDPFEASFPKRFQGVFHHGLDTAEFNPIKSLVTKGSGAPGSCAGHSRAPSRDRGRPLSTGGSGLSQYDTA